MSQSILIVDDEKEIVSMLYHYFSKLGYTVYTATAGNAALKEVEKNPDIILLDVNMPDIAFIDNDLRDCLYEIVTCDFLNKINDLLINANDNEFDNVFEDNFNITAIAELTVRLKQLF